MKKTENSLLAESKNTLSRGDQINFLSNLKYLIVISKAYLKNYQLDDDLKKTTIKTANVVFNECKKWDDLFNKHRPSFKKKGIIDKDHVFYQRAILLAVIIKSFCIGNFMGDNRNKSLIKTVDWLCNSLKLRVGKKDFEKYDLPLETGEASKNEQQINSIEDNRQYERVEYFTSVKLIMDKKKYITELLDLSLGGAFISADSIPHIETGKEVLLEIPFTKKPNGIEIKGTVQRVFRKGAGVKFF